MWGPKDQSGAGGFELDETFNNSTTKDRQKTGDRDQSILPVVVKQIRNCPADQDFTLFGIGNTTQIVVIVGILKDFEIQSTHVSYNIEDHTGLIMAKLWLSNDQKKPSKVPDVKEGCYVQVFGTLREENGAKFIMIMKLRPVDDPNVVNTHLLQFIHTRLQCEAISKNPGEENISKANNPGAALANSMSFMNEPSENVESGGQSEMMNALQDKVYRIMQASDNPNGVHRMKVLSNFPKHQHQQVNAALEFLLNEGHAYSTIDNDHFKSTNNF